MKLVALEIFIGDLRAVIFVVSRATDVTNTVRRFMSTFQMAYKKAIQCLQIFILKIMDADFIYPNTKLIRQY